ncbi:MAG TPA: zinc ribbon domain-containing protein [Fimbriimonadales bacterium]|nr:zinc ribbon domain-containing protein [Fimbriimonadales bacterium]
MADYCHSCAASLNDPQNKGESDVYCNECSNPNGELKSRAEVQELIARWFMRWQPDLTIQRARVRAEHFMRALPAWSDD